MMEIMCTAAEPFANETAAEWRIGNYNLTKLGMRFSNIV